MCLLLLLYYNNIILFHINTEILVKLVDKQLYYILNVLKCVQCSILKITLYMNKTPLYILHVVDRKLS